MVKGPAGFYLFKANNGNNRTVCEICSKLTKKTPERCHWLSFSEIFRTISFLFFENHKSRVNNEQKSKCFHFEFDCHEAKSKPILKTWEQAVSSISINFVQWWRARNFCDDICHVIPVLDTNQKQSFRCVF